MPIFGRRRLQQMLDELGPWLVRDKAADLLNRLENVDPDQALPAEFELALSWAVTRTAQLEIDRPMGTRTPDIYSPDLLPGAPLAIDIAAISDASLSGENLMRRAANIINGTCNQIVKGASTHLHYTFQERSRYLRNPDGRGRLDRRRQITESFQIESRLQSLLTNWLKSGATQEPLRLTSKDIDVVITWQEQVHPRLNTFCTMPSLAYDLRRNPLYRALKSKARQLQSVPPGIHRGIFLGDAGCQLFNDIYRVDRVHNTFSGQQVIETFLAEESKIDFVAVFSVKRATTGSWDSSKNPRIWYLYLFEQKKSPAKLDLGRLSHLRDVLPAPYLSGYEARSRHEQGMFAPQANGQYLPTSMSSGRNSMKVTISARALQELMAGRLTAEQFKNWTLGRFNPFEQNLARGWTIANVSFESKNIEADDDHLTFTFKDDPAAAPLRLPINCELRTENRSGASMDGRPPDGCNPESLIIENLRVEIVKAEPPPMQNEPASRSSPAQHPSDTLSETKAAMSLKSLPKTRHFRRNPSLGPPAKPVA
jgi:hypothetical protein